MQLRTARNSLFAQAGGQNVLAGPEKRLHNYPHVYKYMTYSIHEGNQILMNKHTNQLTRSRVEFIVFMLLML